MGGPGSGRRPKVDLDEEARKAAPEAQVSDQVAVKEYTVMAPSGSTVQVVGKVEKKAYESAVKRYMKDFSFTAASDLDDLGNLIFHEILAQRYQNWVGSGKDWDDMVLTPSQVDHYQRRLNEVSKTIASLKDALGISRQKRMGAESSVSSAMENIRRRALRFGQLRNEQNRQGIIALQELLSIARTYARSNDKERKVAGFPTAESILEWILEKGDEWDELDRAFRQDGDDPQQSWAGHAEAPQQ